jgi:hypothetical protein
MNEFLARMRIFRAVQAFITITYVIAAFSGILATFFYIQEEGDRTLERKVRKSTLIQDSIAALQTGVQADATASQRAMVKSALTTLIAFEVPIEIRGEEVYLENVDLSCVNVRIVADTVSIKSSRFETVNFNIKAKELYFISSKLFDSHIDSDVFSGVGFKNAYSHYSSIDIDRVSNVKGNRLSLDSKINIVSNDNITGNLKVRFDDSIFARTGIAANSTVSLAIDGGIIYGSTLVVDQFISKGWAPNNLKVLEHKVSVNGISIEDVILEDVVISPPEPRWPINWPSLFGGLDINNFFCLKENPNECEKEYARIINAKNTLNNQDVPLDLPIRMLHLSELGAEGREALTVFYSIKYHPQSGWFEEVPSKGTKTWVSPIGARTRHFVYLFKYI